ncbi:putative TPR repeat-containing protein R13F6.10 [Planoprotostelium fungivorum]|uniref:Putative TPR repeat-containing protein R13F6.10 n=1 Tax=Planoprotostelium fungivorum TaxID=1890364 RepID=A0A2P6MWD4_9EUKA|nr:putative TPR repeat-containing protein R13F6.10 [Planoprotostelium fungivorum]
MDQRRVRPIFDAIEGRNWKQALKLCNGLAGKKPDANTPIINALKAMATERLGKPAEAEALLEQTIAMVPTDEITLNTITNTYRSLGRLDKITEMLEKVVAKYPKSEGPLELLWASYARRLEHGKARETAMKLRKLFSGDHYLLWAVQSIVLSVRGQKEGPLLQLAQRMMENLIGENKIENYESERKLGENCVTWAGLFLYLSILEQQENYEKILEVLGGKLGDLYKVEEDKHRYRGDILKKAGKYSEALSVYDKLITEFNADDWSHLIGYLDCGFHSDENHFYEIAREKLHQLQATQTDPKKSIRGPFLAEIELEKRRFERGGQEDQIFGLVVAYVQRFGDRTLCYNDISPYIVRYLDKSEELITAVRATFHDQMEQREFTSRNINFRQLECRLNRYHRLEVSQLRDVVRDIVTEYITSLRIYEKDPKEATEMAIGYPLLLMACQLLVHLSDRTGQEAYILESIALLENGFKDSQYGFPLRLLLLRLYTRLHCPRSAVECFEQLEVKHILLDTLSYLILDPLYNGQSGFAKEITRSLEDFYEENNKQTPEFVLRAFQNGNYSKISEFIQFKERLERSHTGLMSRTEEFLEDIKRSSDLDALFTRLPEISVTEEKIEKMTLNHERSILQHQFPENYSSPYLNEVTHTCTDVLSISSEEQRDRIKLRATLAHLLKSTVQDKDMKENLQRFVSLSEKISGTEFQKKSLRNLVEIFQLTIEISKLNNESTTEDSDAVAQKLNQLEGSTQEIFAELQGQLSTDGRFNLKSIPLLNQFVSENLAWLLLSYQTWSKHVPTVVKKKKDTVDNRESCRTAMKNMMQWLKNTTSSLNEFFLLETTKHPNGALFNPSDAVTFQLGWSSDKSTATTNPSSRL